MPCSVQVLLEKGVDEAKILFLSLVAAPEGIHVLCKRFPRLKARVQPSQRAESYLAPSRPCTAAPPAPCPAPRPCMLQVITSEIDEYIDTDFKVVPGVGNVSAPARCRPPLLTACPAIAALQNFGLPDSGGGAAHTLVRLPVCAVWGSLFLRIGAQMPPWPNLATSTSSGRSLQRPISLRARCCRDPSGVCIRLP